MPLKDGAERNELLRQLPQVDAVLASLDELGLAQSYRRDLLARLTRAEIARLRLRLQKVPSAAGVQAAGAVSAVVPLPSADLLDAVTAAVIERVAQLEQSLIKPVINATGIVLHTNLGRSVLAAEARQAVAAVAAGYSNLELDLASGKRTRRDLTLEPLLCALTGGEAATVVNNNAAAVYLILHALAAPDAGGAREVITSRGELIEIGGSYRVPDVVAASGAVLREVGTTNRTRLADYAQALSPRTALLLKTHPSNYRVRGFTEEASVAELSGLARQHRLPLVVDLGSGYIAPESGPRLDEPDVLGTLAAGADLVCFSGDKLLGGPQAGIVIGSAALISRLRRDALWRALRVDKFTVAALGATLLGWLRDGAETQSQSQLRVLPTLDEMTKAARGLVQLLKKAQPGWQFSVLDGEGSYGGGSLPDQSLPAKLVGVSAPQLTADELDARLRQGAPALVGYVLKGVYMLNMLTLLAGDDKRIAQCFAELGHA